MCVFDYEDDPDCSTNFWRTEYCINKKGSMYGLILFSNAVAEHSVTEGVCQSDQS